MISWRETEITLGMSPVEVTVSFRATVGRRNEFTYLMDETGNVLLDETGAILTD